METLTVEAEIAPDGTLHLDVPSDLPPGKVEVVLIIQPLTDLQPPYPSVAGIWSGFFPEDFNLTETLNEIRREWEQEWVTTE